MNENLRVRFQVKEVKLTLGGYEMGTNRYYGKTKLRLFRFKLFVYDRKTLIPVEGYHDTTNEIRAYSRLDAIERIQDVIRCYYVPGCTDIKANGREPKNTCHKGHPFTKENTVINGEGFRQCRICRNATSNKYKQDKRAKRLIEIIQSVTAVKITKVNAKALLQNHLTLKSKG